MKQSAKYLKILVNLMVGLFTVICFCFILPKLLVFFMPFVPTHWCASWKKK